MTASWTTPQSGRRGRASARARARNGFCSARTAGASSGSARESAQNAWWTSSDGLREDLVRTVFAGFDTSDVDLDGTRPVAVPARGATVVGAVAARRRALAAAARRG